MADANGSSGDEVFAIEQRGIDLITEGERHGRPRELFWMWAGTNLNVFYIVNGVILIALGLSFVQAVAAILLGSLAFLLVGLVSLQGPKTGTATFAISRAPYGPNGARGLSFFNWLTCIGFEASGISLMVLAILAMLNKAGVSPSTPLRVVLILLSSLIVMAVPLLGHATLMTIQRWMAFLAIPIFITMAALVVGKVHLDTLSKGGGVAAFMIGLAVVINGGGLSWANCAADFSRYLPSGTRPRSIFWAASMGGLVPSLLLSLLGAAIASVAKDASDPIAGLPHVLPSWVFMPYLLFLIISTIFGNGVLLYSSGLTLQTIGVPLRRWQCVLVDVAVTTIIAFVVVFSTGFNHYYGDFLGLLGIWLAPWIAIYAVDWLMRRGRYNAPALVDTTSRSVYWRNGGFHLPGVAAQIAGMIAAVLWVNSPGIVGPLSRITDHSDASIFMGVIVAALVYFLTARDVRSEAITQVSPGDDVDLGVEVT